MRPSISLTFQRADLCLPTSAHFDSTFPSTICIPQSPPTPELADQIAQQRQAEEGKPEESVPESHHGVDLWNWQAPGCSTEENETEDVMVASSGSSSANIRNYSDLWDNSSDDNAERQYSGKPDARTLLPKEKIGKGQSGGGDEKRKSDGRNIDVSSSEGTTLAKSFNTTGPLFPLDMEDTVSLSLTSMSNYSTTPVIGQLPHDPAARTLGEYGSEDSLGSSPSGSFRNGRTLCITQEKSADEAEFGKPDGAPQERFLPAPTYVERKIPEFHPTGAKVTTATVYTELHAPDVLELQRPEAERALTRCCIDPDPQSREREREHEPNCCIFRSSSSVDTCFPKMPNIIPMKMPGRETRNEHNGVDSSSGTYSFPITITWGPAFGERNKRQKAIAVRTISSTGEEFMHLWRDDLSFRSVEPDGTEVKYERGGNSQLMSLEKLDMGFRMVEGPSTSDQLDGTPAEIELDNLLFQRDPDRVIEPPPSEQYYGGICKKGREECFCDFEVRIDRCGVCDRAKEICDCWANKRERGRSRGPGSDGGSALRESANLRYWKARKPIREIKIGGIGLRGGVENGMAMVMGMGVRRGRRSRESREKEIKMECDVKGPGVSPTAKPGVGDNRNMEEGVRGGPGVLVGGSGDAGENMNARDNENGSIEENLA